MAELTLVEAVNDALHTELARDDDVMVLGEDVGRAGGVFRATAGLRDRFGPDRCVDTPLAEAGILGGAVGLCMAGWRPVVEMQYDAFSYPSLNQLITHVGRYRWRTGGRMQFPLTIRMPYGGGVRAPELHDDSPEAYYVHTPGIKVAIPSTPADAKGLLAAAIRDPDPVVVLEPKLVYRTSRGEVPEGEYVVPLGEARIAREGSDVTLIAYGAMVPVCELAADAVDVSCEIVDIRSLRPLDERDDPRVGREDRPRRDRARGAAHCGLRRRARRADRRARDLRPAGPGAARHRLRRPVSVLDDRGRVHAVGRARRRRRRLADVIHELPFERRTLHGHFSRDLEPVLTDRPRRLGALRDAERRLVARRRDAVRADVVARGRRARARRPDRGARRHRGPDARRADRRGRARPVGRDVRRRCFAFAGISQTASASRSWPPRSARAVSRRDGHAARRARRAFDDRRRGRRAGTSTARSSSPARRSSCRSPSTVRCSPPATGTRRRATAR